MVVYYIFDKEEQKKSGGGAVQCSTLSENSQKTLGEVAVVPEHFIIQFHLRADSLALLIS
jgi:hypothetical protein